MEVPSDLQNFLNNNMNEKTKAKTKSDLKKFTDFLNEQDEVREISEIPAKELDFLIARFLMSVKKNNGEDYEPSTLRGFQSTIQRHLKSKGSSFNIINGSDFGISQETLTTKMKLLKKAGKGNRDNAARPLTKDEENKLWEDGKLGTNNPVTLLNTIWWMNATQFGMRSREEHRNLCWGDVKKVTDGETTYLEYSERQTKTRTGSDPRDIRLFKPKAYANSDCPERCPVKLYELYASQRPQNYSSPDDPFYLAINHNKKPDSCPFKAAAVGINSLGGIMKKITGESGLKGKITNHSARKTMASTLISAGVETSHVQHLGGWKNINSLGSYATAGPQQQQQMSKILSSSGDIVNDPSNLPSAKPSSNVVLPESSADESVDSGERSDDYTFYMSEEIEESTLVTLEDVVGKLKHFFKQQGITNRLKLFLKNHPKFFNFCIFFISFNFLGPSTSAVEVNAESKPNVYNFAKGAFEGATVYFR